MSTSICEKPTRLEIPSWILAILFTKARAASPREACGYLVSMLHTVYLVRECVNEALLPYEFQLSASVLSEARSTYGDHVILWHSHPTSHALPSRADKQMIWETGVPHLIVSLHPKPQMMLYRAKGPRVVQVAKYDG